MDEQELYKLKSELAIYNQIKALSKKHIRFIGYFEAENLTDLKKLYNCFKFLRDFEFNCIIAGIIYPYYIPSKDELNDFPVNSKQKRYNYELSQLKKEFKSNYFYLSVISRYTYNRINWGSNILLFHYKIDFRIIHAITKFIFNYFGFENIEIKISYADYEFDKMRNLKPLNYSSIIFPLHEYNFSLVNSSDNIEAKTIISLNSQYLSEVELKKLFPPLYITADRRYCNLEDDSE